MRLLRRRAEVRLDVRGVEVSLQEEIEKRSPFESGAIAVRFVVVVDWAKSDGTRWVSRIGSNGLTEWEREGLLHHALHASWDGANESAED